MAALESLSSTDQADIFSLLSSRGDADLLSDYVTKQFCIVDQTPAAPGNAKTIATLTGEGIIRAIQMTVSYGDLFKHGRMQVFVDGETIPSIDVDFGTLWGTAYDGMTNPVVQGTDHIVTSPVGGPYAGFKAWSGALKFPIPYKNGAIVKVYTPIGMTTTGANGSNNNAQIFSQVAYQPGVVRGRLAHLRLKSRGITHQNAVAYGAQEQINWIDLPGVAGWVVALAQATKGFTSNGYLERQQWFAIDGETVTPSSQGAINSSYASSGGEDWPYSGYYFAGQTKINQPDTFVSCCNNANYSNNWFIDFLKRHGGIKFNTGLRGGWSLKDGAFGPGALSTFAGSYHILYYIDTRTAVAPSAPTITGVVASGQATVRVKRPKSDGSQPITAYALTVNGVSRSVTIDPNTGDGVSTFALADGSYTATATATNAVGTSAQGTGTVETETVPTPQPTSLVDDYFQYADGLLAGKVSPQGQTWVTPASVDAGAVVKDKTVRNNTGAGISRMNLIPVGTTDMLVTLDVSVQRSPGYNFAPVIGENGNANVNAAWVGGTLTLYVNNTARGGIAVGAIPADTEVEVTLQRKGNVVTTTTKVAPAAAIARHSYTLTSAEVMALANAKSGGISFYAGDSSDRESTIQNTMIDRFRIDPAA